MSILEQIQNYEAEKAEIVKGVNFDTPKTQRKQNIRCGGKVQVDGEDMLLTSYPKYGSCVNA